MISVLNKVTENILVGVFFVMTLSVVWQVMSRYLFNISASWTEELARFCLMWLAVLGAAYITGKRGHIEIDYFFDKFSPSQKRRLDYFVETLILIFAVVILIIGGAYLMYMTFYLEQKSPALQVPLGLVYCILPISGALMVVYTIDYMKQIKNINYSINES
ncbi:TRAP transporter small permease [Membranicola marinus]|uniref:TRAP transporter small permease n=1 Tax=Membranihabitans marinus TaxID=1227546 RepID=A0A953HMQ7_9BACT|nr:TRAP transporter small permease [Membranihabitans marinus]MBY5958824.1 TRAP transporter small permease [Membranihabitans marinus]